MGSNSSKAQYGTIGLKPPVLSVSSAPDIIFEWAALIPLVIYLATYKFSYKLIGKTALTGVINVGLFPKLGVLDSVADLLKEGSDFLDRACSVSELRRDVWDANWGSTFPCANGAASAMLTASALRGVKPATTKPELPVPQINNTTPETDPAGNAAQSSASSKPLTTTTEADTTPQHRQLTTTTEVDTSPQHGQLTTTTEADTIPRHRQLTTTTEADTIPQHRQLTTTTEADTTPQHRRFQTLHVLQCTRSHTNQNSQLDAGRKYSKVVLMLFDALIILILLGGAVVTFLFGLCGTTAALLISVTFQLCRQMIRITRPRGYLSDSEASDGDGCMLVAIHQNASTWYLYTGDRGIIDSLLNKPMIFSVTSYFGNSVTACLVLLLRFLSLLQLLTMTFVAAQRGWDGIGLLVLITAAWMSDYLFNGDHSVSRFWLRQEGVKIEPKSFEFTGRFAMMGAIQIFKGNPVESWMDGILQPCDRRTVWLAHLGGRQDEPAMKALENSLSDFDKSWVTRNVSLSLDGAQVIRGEFLKDAGTA